MKKSTTCHQTAVNLLTRREHSREELYQKLKIRNYCDDEIENTLNNLQNRNLQSNKRFAECYVRTRAEKGFGPLKIKFELIEKGIDRTLANEVVNVNSSCWIEYLIKTHHKKFGAIIPHDPKEKNKQINYLTYKGFNLDQIKNLVIK